MADNMSADIVIAPRLLGSTTIAGSISASFATGLSLIGVASNQALLLGDATISLSLTGKAGINILAYDDPIDYLMFENGVRMRTETDKYIKTETSP